LCTLESLPEVLVASLAALYDVPMFRTCFALSTLALTLAAQTAPADRPFWRTVVMGTHGAVAAEHPLEARAAMRVLENGGNAFDAAVALFYMTGVVEQHQSGIGGDAFLLAYHAKEKRVVFINGTGPAPALATVERYRKEGGIPAEGILSSTVPGAVGGFDLALKKYGTRQYPELLADAIQTAREGHPLTHWSAGMHASAVKKISPYPSSVKTLMRDGKSYGPGELFLQPDLARTLTEIAHGGADAFYRGSIARRTAAFYEKHGGLLRLSDLAAYQAEEGQPIRASYKGIDVYQSAPNSQGIVLLMALNILEGIDLTSLGHNSPEYLHTLVESLKLAFADRDHYVADPRFTKVPVEKLLSKSYAEQRRKELGPRARAGAAAYGQAGETSSFSIADRFGNLVSVTHSVNSTFGSGIVVEGGGFVLNNRLPYFSLEDGDANVLKPGKRPRHTINPALALKDGKPFLAWNTPGGDNQSQAMLQSFLNMVEFGMNPQQAVEAPTVTTTNFHASNYPQPIGDQLIVPRALADAVGQALEAKGHKLQITAKQHPYDQQPAGAGAVKMLWIDPRTGVFHIGVRPAKDNYALAY
jgi:gamma-glutamyltranspeptidase/glutathione hydrolase